MTTQRIATDRELAELRSGVARSQVHAAKLRERPTRPGVDDIGTRMLNAPQRAPAGDGKPILAGVTAESARTLHAIFNNTPDLATRALGEQFETCWHATESVVERFYAEWPELRWFDLLTGADDRLRKPADDAAAAFRMATAPGVPAIVATSRPSQPWVMHSPDDFETACDAIRGDIHCDLQISGPTIIDRKRYRNCVDWFEAVTAPKPPNADRNEYGLALIGRSFVTLPVARGDLIVLVRVCSRCIGAYLSQNGVDSTECVANESYSDGFGALPWNGLERSTRESDSKADDTDDSDDIGP
jgi:hypothetical protein